MRLYTFFRSSAAYRVRIVLGVKGLAYDAIPKAFSKNEHRAADYLELNPQGLIPALETNGTALPQSLAIIEYLEEIRPSPALLPSEPIARALVRSMALAIACDIHPLNNLRVLNYLRNQLGQDGERVNGWYRHWIVEGFRGLEVHARRFSTRARYCFADSISLADVCLVPQIYNARRFDVELSRFPTLLAIGTHLESLPAFSGARPEVQPDAV